MADRLWQSPGKTPTRSGSASRPASGRSLFDKSPSFQRAIAAAGANPVEQLALLKQKHSALEADSKSAVEGNQWTIKQNRQILLQLKQDNKELKAELAKRGGSQAVKGGSGPAARTAVEREVEALEKDVHSLRRQYDKMMQEKKTAVSKLANLQDQVKELAKRADLTVGSPVARELRSVENRLDKATLKANEAASIQRTYEQLIEKLKREMAASEAQMKVMREQLAAKAQEVDAMGRRQHEAQHAKEQAKQELAALEERVAGQRAKWEATLAEKRAEVRTMQEANKALLAHQYGAGGAAAAVVAGAADASEEGAAGPGPGSSGVISVESVVRKLCAAASTTRVAEMMDRLLTQHESRQNLLGMRQLAEQQAAELQGQMALLQEHMQDLKGGGKLTTQAQLDTAQHELRECGARADVAAAEYDKVLKLWVDVRSGLEHICGMAAPLPLTAPALPLDDEMVGDYIAQLEARLTNASKFVATLPKAAEMLEDLASNPDYAFSKSQQQDEDEAAAVAAGGKVQVAVAAGGVAGPPSLPSLA